MIWLVGKICIRYSFFFFFLLENSQDRIALSIFIKYLFNFNLLLFLCQNKLIYYKETMKNVPIDYRLCL